MMDGHSDTHMDSRDASLLDVSLDPIRLNEQQMALTMVPTDAVTHTAIADGSWFDPSTWADGRIPGDDANVLVPPGVTVLYDGISGTALNTVRIDGKLEFATQVDSKLVVDTMLVTHAGWLQIGNNGAPVSDDVNVDIVFKNNDAMMMDGMSMGLGLVSLGKVDIHGTEKTTHLKVAVDAMAGDTSLTLAETPEGWVVGDEVVLTGTRSTDYFVRTFQDEVRTVTGIDGNTVTFDAPLVYDHDTPRPELMASVANTSRNITLSSDNPDVIADRGHVMLMHNDEVDIRFAAFDELGRTDKSTLDVGSDDNPAGRYALHLHKQGVSMDGEPALLIGNAVTGSPGWGFVQHDSFAIFDHNVAYDVFGASFVAEAGNETGSWGHNIAIGGTGIEGVNWAKQNTGTDNFGNGGVGYYFQGRLVESHDNIAASQADHGFLYFHREVGSSQDLYADGFIDPLSAAYMADDLKIDNDVPSITNFRNNEAFVTTMGMEIIKDTPDQHHGNRSTFENFTAWEVQNGFMLDYTGHYTLKGGLVLSRGDEGGMNGQTRYFDSNGVHIGQRVVDIVIDDLEIDGFHNAIYSRSLDNTLDHSVTFNRLTSVNNNNELENTSVNPDFIRFTNIDPDAKDGAPSIKFSETADLSLDATLNPGSYDSETGTWVGSRVKLAEEIRLDGQLTDSLGQGTYLLKEEHALRRNDWNLELLGNIVAKNGYYELPDGSYATIYQEMVADRLTGEAHVMDIVIQLADQDVSQIGQFNGKLDAQYIDGAWYTNSAPNAAADRLVVNENSSSVIDVFADDNDIDGDALTLVSHTNAQHGTLNSLGDGRFSYTPDAGFVGLDRFDYTVTDASGSGRSTTATAWIQVENVIEGGTAFAGDSTPVVPEEISDDPVTPAPVIPEREEPIAQEPPAPVTAEPEEPIAQEPPAPVTPEREEPVAQEPPAPVVPPTALNAAPIVQNDTAVTGQDNTILVDVTANDRDPEGGDLTLVSVSYGGDTSLVAIKDGKIEVNPLRAFDHDRTEVIEYTVQDADGAVSVGSLEVVIENEPPAADDDAVTIPAAPAPVVQDPSVEPPPAPPAVPDPIIVNLAPMAEHDLATTGQDQTILVDVMANDADPEGGVLRLTSVSYSGDTSLVAIKDGKIEVNPLRAFDHDRTEVIEYTVQDADGALSKGSLEVVIENEPQATEDPIIATPLPQAPIAQEPPVAQVDIDLSLDRFFGDTQTAIIDGDEGLYWTGRSTKMVPTTQAQLTGIAQGEATDVSFKYYEIDTVDKGEGVVVFVSGEPALRITHGGLYEVYDDTQISDVNISMVDKGGIHGRSYGSYEQGMDYEFAVSFKMTAPSDAPLLGFGSILSQKDEAIAISDISYQTSAAQISDTLDASYFLSNDDATLDETAYASAWSLAEAEANDDDLTAPMPIEM